MTTYCLEMRSTADWQDCRYRAYTKSVKKAEAFKLVSKIQFTDSGHGIVPVVTEGERKRGPVINILAGYVQDQTRVMSNILKITRKLSKHDLRNSSVK